MRQPVNLFTLAAGPFTVAAVTILATWWWLGAAVPMPASPVNPGEKLYCVSYAPFRGAQTPLDRSTEITRQQIDEDLAQLAKITDCVRIYSVDFGLHQVPEIARRHGLKVLLGLWVSGHADRTAWQIETGVALAKVYPDVIRAVVVGNEALLRGEIAPAALAALIRRVKAEAALPVTYADVWEFWLRHRELVNEVDFVTIHILPYWEDDPIGAGAAASHVADIRAKVARELAGKEIVIGEVGWPSAGRMREGALPSRVNQARVVHDILARGKAENFRVNVIEAFDQPWKRFLEGTVGGHWGLYDDATRAPKFAWGEPVSNHPQWPWQAAGGVAFAALVFGAALAARRRDGSAEPLLGPWLAVGVTAAVGGALLPWTLELVPLESLGPGGWLRSLAWTALAIAAPLAGAAALVARTGSPGFAEVIGPAQSRVHAPLALTLGILLIALTVLALQAALGLSFDPRYRDFPFAPLTAAVTPFVLLALLTPRKSVPWPLAETMAAAVLALCALFMVWNETHANWQALWFAAGIGLVALTLVRVRGAPG